MDRAQEDPGDLTEEETLTAKGAIEAAEMALSAA